MLWYKKYMRGLAAALALVMAVSLMPAAFAVPVFAEETQQAEGDSTFTGLKGGVIYKNGEPVGKGWQTIKGKKYYCKANGKVFTGRKKINKKWYFFKSNGAQAVNDTKEKKVTYYINKNKNLEAYKKGSKYYKPNGKKMTKAQKDDYVTLRRARKIVKQVTNKNMTKKQKLEACFKYVMKFPYRQYRSFPANNKGWVSLYANDHFIRKGGDCDADAAAFAYLARALGYKNVWVCLDAKPSNPNHHAWTYVNGRYYDPLFAQAKSYSRYWNAKTYPLVTITKKKVAVGYVGDK